MRLFVEEALFEGAQISLNKDQSRYVLQVMRGKEGQQVQLFNGSDGQWHSTLEIASKKSATLHCQTLSKPQSTCPDLWLAFAPIKAGRIDFLAEKATELGVSALLPIRTERTIVSRVNETRLRANAIEATEQSERLDVPEVKPYQKLTELLQGWDEDRLLIYGDETGHGAPPAELLTRFPTPTKAALLVGPEGGFSPKELETLRRHPATHAMSLGPRVLRADTAALAGLTCLQLWLGDWSQAPRINT